jgi:hypothetical protein
MHGVTDSLPPPSVTLRLILGTCGYDIPLLQLVLSAPSQVNREAHDIDMGIDASKHQSHTGNLYPLAVQLLFDLYQTAASCLLADALASILATETDLDCSARQQCLVEL